MVHKRIIFDIPSCLTIFAVIFPSVVFSDVQSIYSLQRSFSFLEFMSHLVGKAGYSVASNEYVLRETSNKKDNISVPRVFLQGKYRKPDKDVPGT